MLNKGDYCYSIIGDEYKFVSEVEDGLYIVQRDEADYDDPEELSDPFVFKGKLYDKPQTTWLAAEIVSLQEQMSKLRAEVRAYESLIDGACSGPEFDLFLSALGVKEMWFVVSRREDQLSWLYTAEEALKRGDLKLRSGYNGKYDWKFDPNSYVCHSLESYSSLEEAQARVQADFDRVVALIINGKGDSNTYHWVTECINLYPDWLSVPQSWVDYRAAQELKERERKLKGILGELSALSGLKIKDMDALKEIIQKHDT